MSRSVVEGVFRDVLSLEGDVDWNAVRYQETTGWDSVAHMAIVADLEDNFEIMLDIDDVIDMSSFHESLRILQKYEVDTA